MSLIKCTEFPLKVLFRLINTAACEWETYVDCSQKYVHFIIELLDHYHIISSHRFSEHMQLFHLHGDRKSDITPA